MANPKKKSKKKQKTRAEFRKHHDTRTRRKDFTREVVQGDDGGEELSQQERISGKGSLTRKRTIVGDVVDDRESGLSVRVQVDEAACRTGRVLSLHGATNQVLLDDGMELSCSTRKLLKSLSMEQRNIVVAGDRVLVRPLSDAEGVIERVEPRHGVLSRTSKQRQHIIVANVDLMLVVISAAEPSLKPGLIDRFVVTAEKAQIQPLICINKVDLVEPADLQPLVGVFGQLGYPILLVSASTGRGIDELSVAIQGRQSVVTGQSGVGKSSLLNRIDPTLNLRVSTVSEDNQKGRHTTTAAHLLPLERGGFIVDTPGIRQFALWDVIPEEVPGLFRDLRPFVSLCRYPDCTHTHESDCAVKDAVAYGRLDARRYESYVQIISD